MMTTDLLHNMLDSAVHFGHKTTKWNPKIKKYLYGDKDGIHIFDLTKTADLLEKAMAFITKIVKENKVIMLVSTKQQAQKMIENLGIETGMPYISQKWIGGFLSNFETVKRRIKYFNDLKDAEIKGEFDKYSKKEAGKLRKTIEKLSATLGGVSTLKKLPDCIFILDCVRDKTAIKEAKKMRIPVVAVVDSNADPDNITYPIPGNDDAVKSISFFIDVLKNAILAGKAGNE